MGKKRRTLDLKKYHKKLYIRDFLETGCEFINYIPHMHTMTSINYFI